MTASMSLHQCTTSRPCYTTVFQPFPYTCLSTPHTLQTPKRMIGSIFEVTFKREAVWTGMLDKAFKEGPTEDEDAFGAHLSERV